jgi:hypothetical protein
MVVDLPFEADVRISIRTRKRPHYCTAKEQMVRSEDVHRRYEMFGRSKYVASPPFLKPPTFIKWSCLFN